MIRESDVQKLITKLEHLQAGDVFVPAGSIPGSVPDDIYRRIMSEMSGRGIEVVVDATKELLVNVLEYHPFLIRPNHHELGEVFGVELETREDVIPYARRMQQMGARNVLVSMAAAGAVLVAEDKSVYETDAPKGILVNGVGAGDSMVAGFTCRMDGEKRISSCVCHGRLGRKRQCVFGTTCRKKEIMDLYRREFTRS